MAPGITIDRWGPAAWNTLHVVAHTAPHTLDDAQRDDMRAFLRLFGKHLPCPSCRRHFLHYLEAHLTEDALKTRAGLVRVVHDAHNDVNLRLGKPLVTLAEDYALYSRDDPAATSWNACVAISAVAAVVTLLILRRRTAARSGCAPLWRRDT
jgi:hypothetical protein